MRSMIFQLKNLLALQLLAIGLLHGFRSIFAIRMLLSSLAMIPLFLVSSSYSQAPPKEPGNDMRSVDELLLFFPSKHPDGDWNPNGLQFQDVDFVSEDNVKLHGWYCPAAKPKGSVLVSHGNAGNIAYRAQWIAYLQTTCRLNVFMYDYRGYGRSKGKPTVEGALKDARAARAKLCELASIKDEDILLMGESLGGAISVQLASESKPRALILQSTFSSLRDVASVHYARLAWLVPKNKLNSTEAISKYQGPLLLSHGNSDRTIPIELGEKLYQAAPGPKSMVVIQSADHNDWDGAEYRSKLEGFLRKVCK